MTKQKGNKQIPLKTAIVIIATSILLGTVILGSITLLIIRPHNLFNVSKTQEIESETVLSDLSKEEKILFDILIDNSYSFYNPSSLRVLESNGKIEDNSVRIKIQAENKVGGIVTKDYIVYVDDFVYELSSGDMTIKKGTFKEADMYSLDLHGEDIYSVGKLNRAIKEYWDNEGIN